MFVLLLPVKTSILHSGDDIADKILQKSELHDGDIIVVSSKAVATCEGNVHTLNDVKPSEESRRWAEQTGQDSRFVERILEELKRLNGTVVRACPGALLTEVAPKGMTGSLLIANAGLDQSNAGDDHCIGWPVDPVTSVRKLHDALSKKKKVSVIITDSCCLPRRSGVIAIALTVAGFDPIRLQKGARDLFGRALALTNEALADQLATAANSVMGNADQSIPAVIIRDHGIHSSNFIGWVPGIAKKEDIFGS